MQRYPPHRLRMETEEQAGQAAMMAPAGRDSSDLAGWAPGSEAPVALVESVRAGTAPVAEAQSAALKAWVVPEL